MAVSSAFAIDVTDFETEVITRSHTVPVLVDFWASWCRPCLMLGPVLEKLADEFAGAFFLAKVDTDQNQAVARKYGVRGIPDVKLFRDGAVVDGFVGALPEARVRAFLLPHCPSEAQLAVDEGQAFLTADNLAAADKAYQRALGLQSGLEAAHLGLARVALARAEYDVAAEHLGAIGRHSELADTARHLTDAIALIREAASLGSAAEVRTRVREDEGDLAARFALGSHEVAAGRYREALEAYLAIAQKQRKWRDEAARKAMLTVFGIVGIRHPLANEFRQELMLIY